MRKKWFDSLKFNLKTTYSFSVILPMVKSLIHTLIILAQVGISHLEFLLCLLPILSMLYFCSLLVIVEHFNTVGLLASQCSAVEPFLKAFSYAMSSVSLMLLDGAALVPHSVKRGSRHGTGSMQEIFADL